MQARLSSYGQHLGSFPTIFSFQKTLKLENMASASIQMWLCGLNIENTTKDQI